MALFCAWSPPTAAFAADPPTPLVRDAFADVFAAMQEGIDRERMVDAVCATFARQLTTASPQLVEVEAAFPGFSGAIAEAIKPVMRAYSARVTDAYRPRMIAIFRQMLTESEARDVAALYRSPIGRKLLGGVSTSFEGTAIIASGLRDRDIDADAVKADTEIAARRSVGLLSQDEITALGELAMRRPGVLKMGKVGEKVTALRVQMENEPLIPAEEAEMERLIQAAAKIHIAKFAEGGNGT